MKNICIYFFVLCLFSCTSKESHLTSLIKEWDGRTIEFPKDQHFTVLGEDVSYPFCGDAPYKIVSYVDSIGCISCKLQLVKWKHFIKELDSISSKQTSILFYMHPCKVNELLYLLRRDNFNYPVCIDANDTFNQMNHFPSDMTFQTFLLDKDNKVVAIGNPVHNSKVKELYMNIIQGKIVTKEENEILTKIQIKEHTISLGYFNWQNEQKVLFMIYNVGKQPLIINDVTTSCGCISADYSKQPVRPGDSISLQVIYKADHPEHFDKTITVYCNTSPSLVHLKIMGDAE